MQAFLDSLPSPAWSAETRPTEVFPQPVVETPVPEPAKPGVTARSSKEQISAQVFPIPSPVTPLPDPLKARDTDEGTAVRPCRTTSTLRRVGHLGNKSERFVARVEQYIEDTPSSDFEDGDYKRCELCVHYRGSTFKKRAKIRGNMKSEQRETEIRARCNMHLRGSTTRQA